MFQNKPNPYDQATTIDYRLPMNCTNSLMVISDLTGKQVSKYALATDSKSLTIQAKALVAGTYNYSLVCDGKLIATKQMMIIE